MDDFKTKLFWLVIILFAARLFANSIHDPTIHRGRWYTVTIPEGWPKKVQDNEVFFQSPARDIYGYPEAIFSIYGVQSRGALFMDMFFEDVLIDLAKQKGRLLDKGQIKIDDQISNWTLFQMQDPEWIIWTFYVIDDFSRLTKIQFMVRPHHFAKYRPVFEAFKDSIRF